MPWLRCTLRFSQPLSALLPPKPSQLISSGFRPWDSPYEDLILTAVPYVLSNAAPFLGLAWMSKTTLLPLQGLAHHNESRPEACCLDKLTCGPSLGFFPSKVC